MRLDDLLPRVLPDVPGCPDVTAKNALLDSAIELCRGSAVWTEIQDQITLVDGVSSYDLEAPPGAAVHAVLDAWADSYRLTPMTMRELTQHLPNWQSAAGSTPVAYNCAADLTAVRVFPCPQGSRGAKLRLRVSYAPTILATTLPDQLVQEYLETLLAGAWARLMMVPGRQWSNPQLASYHRQRYDSMRIDARISTLTDRTPGTLTVYPRRFGA